MGPPDDPMSVVNHELKVSIVTQSCLLWSHFFAQCNQVVINDDIKIVTTLFILSGLACDM